MTDLDLHTTGVRCIFDSFSAPCIVFLVFVILVFTSHVYNSLLNNLSCSWRKLRRAWEICHFHFTPAGYTYRLLPFHAHSLHVSFSYRKSSSKYHL